MPKNYTEIVARSSSHSVLSGPTTYRENSFENSLIYQRKDNKRVEMVIAHPVNVAGDAPFEPTLCLAVFRLANNPNCNAEALLNMSMEEARLLRDFLNRPEIWSYLEEER